jgi:hypothetical protein
MLRCFQEMASQDKNPPHLSLADEPDSASDTRVQGDDPIAHLRKHPRHAAVGHATGFDPLPGAMLAATDCRS